MLNKSLSIFLFTFICFQCYSQNLVPNPSFEYYSQCPDSFEQISRAFPWFQPLIVSSSDYYNSCNKGDINNSWIDLGTPRNAMGYQYPRTGSGYAGIAFSSNYFINFREYIEVKLKNSLAKNKKYNVSFYLSLAENSDYSEDGFSLYFSDTVIKNTGKIPKLLPFTPQINNKKGNIITDTINWVKISGEYTARGGELYILIGNFLPDSLLNFIIKNSCCYSYYYIDDVSVYPSDSIAYSADAGSDKTITCRDSVQIGTPGRSEYLYEWYKFENLKMSKFENEAHVWVKPSVTTTYILKQKDFKFDETMDTVIVTVEPVTKIDVGNDAICRGDSVELRITNYESGIKYKWTDISSQGLVTCEVGC